MMKRELGIICALALSSAGHCLAAVTQITPAPELPTSMPWNLKELSQPPAFRWLDDQSPIRSLAYSGHEYKGRATEVFAYYATPGSISGDKSKDKNLPAVVLIHGGGGTAFAEWVLLWAERGYAAIAMDLGAKRLDPPNVDPATGKLTGGRNIKRHPMENGGPAQGHEQKFNSIGGPKNDHWPYHAVANAIRAHSLIRSFQEVDETRTAVTGISWGGYTTCLVASLDNRFKAAVPVYGCGFLHEGESVQKKAIDALGPELRQKWVKHYDPSSYLPACRVPMFFVNGNKDIHYPLDSYARSIAAVKADSTIRIKPSMGHSHPAGWRPAEIGLFIDSHCKGAPSLPKLNAPKIQNNRITVRYQSAIPLKQASLHYTHDDGLQSKRAWKNRPATIANEEIDAGAIPEKSTIWLITATDERGALVSSQPQFQTNN